MEKVKWGVLGTAGIARGQTIPAMQQAGNCVLYAIAGRNYGKAQLFQTDFGFEKAYGSFDELLNDPQVEAVYIPLPNDLHREWVIRALKAKGLPYTPYFVPGSHDWFCWPEMFRHFAQEILWK